MELEVNEKYKAVYETEMSRKPKTEWDDNCCSCQSESTEGEVIWCGPATRQKRIGPVRNVDRCDGDV